MKLVSFFALALVCCRAWPQSDNFQVKAENFAGASACFIAYDLKNNKQIIVYGAKVCQQRMTACSTFKMPLALMGFDAGILQDESTKMKWDGKVWPIESWNHDTTAAEWIKNSVVWYSQKLTPKLGLGQIQKYLKTFDYGNQDFSSGITSAWLTVTKEDTDPKKGSLKISPYEQLEFLKKFWNGSLAAKKEALEKTKRLLFNAKSPQGFELYGKTGSGNNADLNGDFGWFIARVAGKGRDILTVTLLVRPTKTNDSSIPGLLAKDITKKILSDNQLW